MFAPKEEYHWPEDRATNPKGENHWCKKGENNQYQWVKKENHLLKWEDHCIKGVENYLQMHSDVPENPIHHTTVMLILKIIGLKVE